MKREFAIAEHANVIGVQGLIGELHGPTDYRKLEPFPFLWLNTMKQTPDYMRWSWNPATGDMLIGTVARHMAHIPKSETYPFYAWVRGFYFPKERTIAVRPYDWPVDPYADADRERNKLVADRIERLLRVVMPDAKIVREIDNKWLMGNWSHYSTSW